MLTERDLKKLRRNDLLDVIMSQSRELERLRQELEETKEKLEDRSICISNAGSIAEASLELSGIFKAAQSAADQYVENVTALSARTEKECQQKSEDCQKTVEQTMTALREKCDRMEVESRTRCEQLENETEQQCQQMKEASEREQQEAKRECMKLRAETALACRELEAEAKSKAEQYWKDLSVKLEQFYADRKGLKELMDIEVPTFDAQEKFPKKTDAKD